MLNVQNMALLGGEKGCSFSVFVKTEPIMGGDEGHVTKTLLATLRVNTMEQFQTSMVFGYDVPLSFEVSANNEGGKSKAEVHISGYLQPGPADEEDDDDEYGEMGYGGMPYFEDEDEEDGDDEEDDEDDRHLQNMVAGSDDDSDEDSDYQDPRVEELPSNDDEKTSVKKKSGDKRKVTDESDSDDTPSDSEDEQLDEMFINKMIKRHRSDEIKKGNDGTGTSSIKKEKPGKSPSDSGKKKKKGKGSK